MSGYVEYRCLGLVAKGKSGKRRMQKPAAAAQLNHNKPKKQNNFPNRLMKPQFGNYKFLTEGQPHFFLGQGKLFQHLGERLICQ